jgi:hypothetical protein
MMLINHISNMYSSTFLKKNYNFKKLFRLSKLVQVGEIDELSNILHFQHNVVLKCPCKFSTFKYYNRIHQTCNRKVGLNSI